MKDRNSLPAIRSLGIYVTHLVPLLEPVGRWIYSKLPESMHDTPTSWLQLFFRGEANIYFIQVGAFDGVAGDPIRPLVIANPNWQGALVEPQKGAFERLRNNYARFTERLHFFNCAISNSRGSISLFEVEESEIARLDLPSWSEEIASNSESHILIHFPNATTRKRSVPCVRVADISNACHFSKVDLIVLDVEGHERPIIDDIDFDGLGVRALVFEHKHLSEPDHTAVLDRLKAYGFSVRRYGRDTLAHRE